MEISANVLPESTGSPMASANVAVLKSGDFSAVSNVVQFS